MLANLAINYEHCPRQFMVVKSVKPYHKD
ncbi:hypothetical protein BLA29_012705 [Euroglyphus maynei]|uniref:Uncharacterized protein n=1 Tax=Euroglyphus maynei TaxID=6958 RepID=A0A1Y3AQ84_EURMA|nr:hypothetical protein BLA29_012705 [Euroglyphus maynei]